MGPGNLKHAPSVQTIYNPGPQPARFKTAQLFRQDYSVIETSATPRNLRFVFFYYLQFFLLASMLLSFTGMVSPTDALSDPKEQFARDRPRRLVYDLHRIADDLKIRVVQHELDMIEPPHQNGFRANKLKATLSMLHAVRQHADLCHDQVMEGMERAIPTLEAIRGVENQEAEEIYRAYLGNISIWRDGIVHI
jgi:hypothetical protein